MSDPGPVLAVIQPQLDALTAQLNVSIGLLNNDLNMIQQALGQLADVAEKATSGGDVSGELANVRAMISAIVNVNTL
jgi:hypothetical protein